VKTVLVIAFGGALGAVGRYYVVGAVERGLAAALGAGFPYGTLAANAAGSFALGALTQGLAVSFDAGVLAQRFLFVGLLGGFTTFSAFSAESVALLERGEVGRAMLYIALSVLLSLGGFWLGLRLVRAVL